MKFIGLAFIKFNKLHPLFATQDEAAIDFVRCNNPNTHHDNRERGSYIYKTKVNNTAMYFYLNESPGAHDNIVKHAIFDYVVGLICDYKRGFVKVITFRPTAFVHTHPSCACHVGDDFSKQDKFLTLLPGVTTVYLGSPKGILYGYKRGCSDIRTVSVEMPLAAFKFKGSGVDERV